MVYIRDEEDDEEAGPGRGMVSLGVDRNAVRNVLRGVLVILAGGLMILPAYLNYEIFSRLRFELVVSLSISIMFFALGILIFTLVMGKEAFEPKK